MKPTCTLCPSLVASRKKICWPETFSTTPDHPNPQVYCTAEMPGENENKAGRPLIGKSGDEARHHLTVNGIAGRGVILDNICKCWPGPGNRDPHADEIANCTITHLIPNILTVRPKWIISMGRISTRFFLGDVDMELTHGIPRTIDFYGLSVVVIPTYHPAAGMHSPEQMILFQGDMRVAGDVVRGKVDPHPPVDEWPEPDYQIIGERDSATAY